MSLGWHTEQAPSPRGALGGRARAGLQASSQSPHHWQERWEGAMPQGLGGLEKPVQGAADAAAPQATAHPLPAALSLPPPASLSRQLPKAGPGSQAGRSCWAPNAPAGSQAVAAAEGGGCRPWHVLVPISWPGQSGRPLQTDERSACRSSPSSPSWAQAAAGEKKLGQELAETHHVLLGWRWQGRGAGSSPGQGTRRGTKGKGGCTGFGRQICVQRKFVLVYPFKVVDSNLKRDSFRF